MQQVVVTNQTQPLNQPLKAGNCDSFLTRLRGLMFRRTISQQEGLLLTYSKDSRTDSAIHMFFVGFDIAVIWINRQGEVVDTCVAKSWRPFYMPAKPACHILEAHPQRLAEFRIGDRILFEHASGD